MTQYHELVSVIIPVFNAEIYIEDTLQSVLRQTYKPIEVIVIDDGSTDATLEKVKKFSEKITILEQANAGVAVARNVATKKANGSFFCFLDADDLWEKEKIEKQIEAFNHYPNVGLVATCFSEIDNNGEKLGRERNRKPFHFLDKPVHLYNELLTLGNFLCLSSCMVRREVFLESGGFYSDKRILSADYDLWIRLSERHLFFVLSEVLSYYRVLTNSMIHGSLDKEYGAQMNILQMHQHRFSNSGYRNRLSKLYQDWADSALFERHPDGWAKWRMSIKLNPFSIKAWYLGFYVAITRIFYRLGFLKTGVTHT